VEVIELLVHLVDRRTGRLEPSLDYIARTIRRARSAVAEALARLRAHGLVDWLRRYTPVEREGPGPRVRQYANAYRLALPARAARLLGRWGRDVPLPDDVVQAQAERMALEDKRMKERLAAKEEAQRMRDQERVRQAQKEAEDVGDFSL